MSTSTIPSSAAQVAALSPEAQREFIEQMSESAAGLVAIHIPGCAGACLGTSALLGYVLRESGIQGLEAVRGEYDGEAHWWLRHSAMNLIIDPTREQFHGCEQPTVIEGASDHHREISVFAVGWDRDQATLEFSLMFSCPDPGLAQAVLAELEELVEYALIAARSI